MTAQPQDPGREDASSLRHRLVEELARKNGLHDARVRAAFLKVPRHVFVPGVPLEEAYTDRAIVNKEEQGVWVSSSSQPAIMALMLEQLDLQPGHSVLEIGAGTGYNAALMAELIGEEGQVISVDIDEDIVAQASERLANAGYPHVKVVRADGGFGYPSAAPYDRVILTASAADILPAWVQQLKPGGRLLLPLALRPGSPQVSIAFDRVGDHLVSASLYECSFMSLRGAFAAPAPIRTPVGTDPDLYIESLTPLPFNMEDFSRWLTGAARDLDTGVDIHLATLFEGLRLWLDLHLPEGATLVAAGDQAERNIIPPLIGFSGEWKSMTTFILPGKAGFAALMRPPGQNAPLASLDDLFASEVFFRLYVRSFGDDDSLAQRLIDTVRSWETKGRIFARALHIRAYPKTSPLPEIEADFLVEKPSVWLALDYDRSSVSNRSFSPM